MTAVNEFVFSITIKFFTLIRNIVSLSGHNIHRHVADVC